MKHCVRKIGELVKQLYREQACKRPLLLRAFLHDAYSFLRQKSQDLLIELGNIVLWKENYTTSSFCIQREDVFNYQGIPNALCGRTAKENDNGELIGESFTPLRIRVIQMIE